MGAAPRYARPFVAVFLAILVACALIPLNLWPFSNWELFSRLRGPIANTWQAVVVKPDGHFTAYFIPPHTACAPLLRGETARFGPATAVRIYHFKLLLSDRIGDHAAPPHRTLVVTCTAQGAHASG